MKENFESKISNIVNQHEEIVDNEILWAGISAGIQPIQKKRRFTWIWLFSGVSILLLLLTAYYVSNPTFDNNMELTEVAVERLQNALNHANIEETRSNIESASKFSSQSSIHTDSQENQQSIDSKISNLSNEGSKDIYGSTNSSHFTKTKISNIPNLEKLVNDTRHMSLESAEAKLENLEQSLRTNVLVSTLNKYHSHKLHSGSEIKKLELNTSTFENIEKIESDARLRWNLYTSFSIGTKTTDALYNTYNTKEKYAFGIDYVPYSWKNISLILGLNYSVIVDEFSFSGSYIQNIDKEVVTERIYYINSQVVENSSLEEVEATIQRQLLKYPKRNIISIPIGLEYVIPLSQKRWSLHAKYYLSYQLASEFYLINTDGIPSNVKGNAQWLNSPFEIGINYKGRINDMLGWNISLDFQQFTYSSNTGDFDVIHKNRYLGISTGLAF